jgi:purine-nucleoside phosphorylase
MNGADSFTQWAEVVNQAKPRIAFILGSGMGALARRVQNPISLSFSEIPAFATATVHGHRGSITLGTWMEKPVLMFEGRLHFYEGHTWRKVVLPIVLAKELGVIYLVLTNAAGGIHDALTPGSFMAIRDNIEWTTPNSWQQRGMGGQESAKPSPYSSRLLNFLCETAQEMGESMHVGTYAAVTGPSYETPAEIRALRSLGADAVGMSTAREAQTAFDAGLECLAISCISNRAAGLGMGEISHDDVLMNAGSRINALGRLLEKCFIRF